MELTTGRKQILLHLANSEWPVHPVEIYREAKPVGMDHPNSVLKAVKEMADQNLLGLEDVGTKDKPSYRCSLPNSRDAFLKLAEVFLESNERLQFLESKYVQKMITQELVDYIQERLKTYWDEKQKSTVLELVKMSPSALRVALFSKEALSQRMDVTMRKKQPSVFQLPEKFKEIANTSALAMLQSNLISDLSVGQTVKMENVRTYAIALETSLDSRPAHECATKSDLGNVLKLQTKQVVGHYTAAEPIEAGELVSLKRAIGGKRKKGGEKHAN